MVTPVDTSLNLLSSRPPAQDLGTAAAGASTDAVGAMGSQVGAQTSPALLRGSSLATDAWIATAPATALGAADSAVQAVGDTKDGARGTTSKASADLSSASSSTGMRSKKLSIASEDMLVDAIITFNQTLQRLPALEKQLQEFQSGLSGATDARMVSYLHQMIELTVSAISQATAIVRSGPGAIEDGLAEIKRTRGVTGTIYTRNPDGSFSFGQFSIHVRIPEGLSQVTLSHDGSGTAIKNVYSEDGVQSSEVPLT